VIYVALYMTVIIIFLPKLLCNNRLRRLWFFKSDIHSRLQVTWNTVYEDNTLVAVESIPKSLLVHIGEAGGTTNDF
jgi:hypothetical protein